MDASDLSFMCDLGVNPQTSMCLEFVNVLGKGNKRTYDTKAGEGPCRMQQEDKKKGLVRERPPETLLEGFLAARSGLVIAPQLSCHFHRASPGAPQHRPTISPEKILYWPRT